MNHQYELAERPDVYAVMPRDAKCVLDVGCGRGGFCRLVKRYNPKAEVWGMDMDEGAAGEAASWADRVIAGTFPEDLPVDMSPFDAIVFSDVLEHMIEPEASLIASVPLLSENGVVIASIPNIRHWRAIKKIFIKGDFSYTDTGLFDRTHLRFYTRSTMLSLFEANGFAVERCVPSNVMDSWVARLVRWVSPRFGEEVTALHYIIRGRPRRKE